MFGAYQHSIHQHTLAYAGVAGTRECVLVRVESAESRIDRWTLLTASLRELS